ncbi:hypothetical protein AB0O70_05470 [Microbacterium paraoxydans]|uniref:hypothetical protein n=1 Tax=Microbacterium paraoxydans TaxID=199592 RepID=UPI0034381D8A
MSVDILRDSADVEDEPDVTPPVDEEAFEQAAVAKEAQPITALVPRWRRKSRASVVLEPSERIARKATLKLRAREQDVSLKRLLAWVAISAVILQLLVADAFLAYYMLWAKHPPSETVLIAWLSASVVEVIGIVAIVARNLFPNRTKRYARARKKRKKK